MSRSSLRREPGQQRSQETVRAIMAAAADLIGSRGTDELSMTELARAAGLSKPALYRYFPNKQAIYRQLALDMFEENRAMVAEGVARTDADLDRVLREAIRGYCALQHARPYRTYLRAAISANPELADLDLADSRTNAATVSEALTAPGDGEIPQSVDDTLFLMMSLVDTLAHVTRLVPSDEAERLMDRFGAIFAAALGLSGDVAPDG